MGRDHKKINSRKKLFPGKGTQKYKVIPVAAASTQARRFFEWRSFCTIKIAQEHSGRARAYRSMFSGMGNREKGVFMALTHQLESEG
jgi:hypothetical protein